MGERQREGHRVQVDCGATPDNPGRTIQSEKDGTDINIMMATFQKTGQIPQTTQLPMYGDFSNAVDYMEACQLKKDADNMFMSLPANVRSRFKNNPAELLAFMADEENKEEAEELGLVRTPDPAPETEPPETPADPPTEEPSS